MNFIIAIGGTGIRCLESFIYLCTIGMCDGMEFNVLLLDTDIQNGNKERVNNLIDNYTSIKGANPTPTYKTFFSARINKHVFTPAYDPANGNFQLLANLANPTNCDLADLFFDKVSQNFNLEHGYRAQTQIGSYLMYHGILDAVRRFVNNQDNAGRELVDFINKVYQAGVNARIFIMGSVFGGTGASSIPIIPRAIDHAIRIIDGVGQLHRNSIKSCVLLTHYFTFNTATLAQVTTKDGVIADSGKFAINSQAALMFYEDDDTVRNTYNIMYHIGYPYKPANFDEGRAQGSDVRTGGVAQTNPAHILEFLAASAGYDFFRRDRQDLSQLNREIVYKTIDEQNDHLVYSPANFFPTEDSVFRKKLASFYLLNFFLKDVGWDLNNFLRTIRRDNNVRRYNGLEGEQQLDSLNEIIRKFGFHIAANIEAGWLWQLKQSTDDSTLFFNPESYVNKRNEISEFNYGKLLKNIDIVFTNFWYRSPYDRVKRRFLKSGPSKEQKVVSPIECLLAQFYNTFDKLI
jgi:hypothetical protein